MAKITELVKVYKLLNDPNAPDWNVKFIGAVVLALAVVAAGAGVLYSLQSSDDDTGAAPAAATSQEAPACTAADLQAYLESSPATPPRSGDLLPSGCRVA